MERYKLQRTDGAAKKAGLNPGLIYGMSGGGGVTTGSGSGGSVSGGNAAGHSGEATALAQTIVGLGLQRAQQKNIEADTKLKEAQAAKTEGVDTAEAESRIKLNTQESLNRYRALSNGRKGKFDEKMYTTKISENVYNVYPIYDWKAEDDWIYFAKYNKCYNEIYDRFHQAGLTLHQMRVDEPFGDTTRRSLWLYQIIEPDTWAKMVYRMSGANSGALYSKTSGNILGNNKITLPETQNIVTGKQIGRAHV